MQQNNGRMLLSESIAPIFPYQYAHARRIYCDTAASISDTMNTMQAVTYGWWINSRLYQFSDPDLMRFSGVTANENQSRLINCAVAGTVFLNSDDLTSAAGQNLARTSLTNSAINEVARSGVSFRPVEGNTGTGSADVFVRQDGNTWYVAVFNYSASSANKVLTLSRLGISGTYTAVDLWSGASSIVSGATWTVSLGARQSKLFRLGSGTTTATGPANQALVVGDSTTFTTVASGTPPFNYVWKKNGATLPVPNASTITLSSVNLNDAGVYSVIVTGGNGAVTNYATLTLSNPTNIASQWSEGRLNLNWPVGYTGWRLQTQTNDANVGLATNWLDVSGSDATNGWVVPIDASAPAAFFRLTHP
jgi:hypothetical protein